MANMVAKLTGSVDWKPGDEKVSSSRIVLYCAFAFVAVALFYAGFRMTVSGQPYAEMQAWVEDVVQGAKWFLAPYGASAVRDTIVGRSYVEQKEVT